LYDELFIAVFSSLQLFLKTYGKDNEHQSPSRRPFEA